MSSRRLWIVLVILFIPTVASADDHRADWFFGGARARGSWISGFQTTIGVTLQTPESKGLALVLDVTTYQWGTHEGRKPRRNMYMAGARWSFAREEGGRPRFVPAVHALVGVVGDSGRDSKGAIAIGGSLDFIPDRRADGGGWGIRAQADYVIRDADSFPRFSVGGFYRFGDSRASR